MKSYLSMLLAAAIISIGSASASQLPQTFGKLELDSAIASLPARSDQPFVEARLVDNGEVGVRVFRVYHPVGAHNHAFSSTYLTIVSGRARFKIEQNDAFEAGKGDMVFWERGITHEVEHIIEHPLVFVAVDAPTRREGDVQK